jgi:hypothetical protein
MGGLGVNKAAESIEQYMIDKFNCEFPPLEKC